MAMDDSPAQAATSMYERYIACLNARNWSELGDFVAADVVHNGRRLGVDGYQAMLEQNYRDIPDLYFNIDQVVTNESHVASRLRFDCSPIDGFLGVPVNGRRVVFYEHAFYTLREDKIAEVFSVIDKAASEAQLTDLSEPSIDYYRLLARCSSSDAPTRIAAKSTVSESGPV
jgi:predicted ester cyclase